MTIPLNKNIPQIVFLDLKKIRTTLYFSKEDLELYHFMLSIIASNHPEISKQNRAIRFLVNQIKMEHWLDKIIDKYVQLNNYWKMGKVAGNLNQEITQQLEQLHTEIGLFNKIHFKVKRTHMRFTTEHFKFCPKSS